MMGSIIKIYMVVAGLVIFGMNLFSLARRKMAPTFSVVWSVFAVMVIVLGFSLQLSTLMSFMSWSVAILLLFSATCAILSVYLISLELSELIARNHELTMQVSLLNEENRRFRKRLEHPDEEGEEE